MNYRWKTIGGLLLVALLGVAAAIAFRRTPGTSDNSIAQSQATIRFGSPARGRIVPLVIDETAPLPAFVPAESRSAGEVAAMAVGRLQSQPTIRASAATHNGETPELSQVFPRPRALPAIDDNDNARADRLPTPEAAEERGAGTCWQHVPIRHVIVDGDTLPLLAQRYLGDSSRAVEIFEQNRQALPSPDLLPLGVEINIAGE